MFIEFIKPGVKSFGIGNIVKVAAGDIYDVDHKQAEFFIKRGHAKLPSEEITASWLDVEDKILGYLAHNDINGIDELTVYTKQQLIDMPKLGKSAVSKIINALGDDYVLATNE